MCACACVCVLTTFDNYFYHYYFQCYLNITVYQSFWHHHLVYQLPRSASQSCQSVLPQRHCQSVLLQSHCLVYHCYISITVLYIRATSTSLPHVSVLPWHHHLVYQSYINITVLCTIYLIKHQFTYLLTFSFYIHFYGWWTGKKTNTKTLLSCIPVTSTSLSCVSALGVLCASDWTVCFYWDCVYL